MKRRAKNSKTRAFTLIELMLVIAMMAILAGAVGMALAQAMEQGRVQRTQAQIARIHGLLMTRYDSYRTKSVRLTNNIGLSSANPTWDPQDQLAFNNQRRVDRLRAIRLTMRLEMPENLRDLFDLVGTTPVPVYGVGGAAQLSSMTLPVDTSINVITNIRRPGLSDGYFRRIQAAIASAPNDFTLTGDNAPSECLYLILSSIQDGDTNGLDFLLPSEIADKDQDGIPEILDAWGRPIFFLRWAAGFESPLQNHKEADPFDPLKVDSRSRSIDPATGAPFAYALTPLVYSAGPDGSYGLVYSADTNFTYSASTYSTINEENDPYSLNPLGAKFGSLLPSADGREGWHDNIVSHFLSNN